jgi:DNA helicase II / ATP-dependent DNA helicase PcrA
VGIDYERELNPAQRQAVLHESGPVLVIAGAGSGKTRTLVYRVARLLETGVYPESILLLTFTRRAAEEMLFRASSILDSRCGQVDGGTFHSVANRLLRVYGDRLHLPQNFSILDRSDSEDIISWVRKEKGFNEKTLRFPRKRILASMFSRSVNTGMSLGELVTDRYAHLERFVQGIIEVWEGYTIHKRENGLLDYDDLLVFFKILLEEDDWVRKAVTRRYSHVLVDEFQDTNHIQADIVEMLGGGHQNVMAVGDDSQSIYSFRGARFQNIIEFPERFPGTTVIKLEQNYRSTQPVLKVANHIIAEAPTPYTKCLYTMKEGGPEPELAGAETEHEQSMLVAQGIGRLMQQGVRPSEIAVLFRSSFHSFDLEVELANRGYSFVKYGGFKFLELAHIKDVLSHLRVIANSQDRFAWNRVLLLVPGVGMARARKIMDQVYSSSSAVEGLAASPDLTKLPKLKELAEMLVEVKSVRGDPGKRIELIMAYYRPLLESQYDDHPKRWRHLDELSVLAHRFTSTTEFLAEVTLEPPQEERGTDYRKGDGLTLSTIHSAKGLEWTAVFLIWAAEGWFPSTMAIDDSEDLEEERRLTYVAVTRAKKYLSILYPKTAYKRDEGRVWVRPSRFIEHLKSSQPCRPKYAAKKGGSDLLLNLQLKYGGSLTGRTVIHPTFGKGKVVGHQGLDVVMVDFESKGLLSLNLKFAPLEVLGD